MTRFKDYRGDRIEQLITQWAIERQRDESIANVEHKNETIGEGAVAGPAREPRGLQHAGNHQHHAGPGKLRQHDPQGERQRAGAQRECVPIGFLLLGAAILWPSEWPASAGLHAWMVGAIGLMTLAVMTRASLGHTGHELAASVPTQVIYFCALVAALARIVAAFEPPTALLYAAAFAWVLAFGGFAAIFGPLPAAAKRPGDADRIDCGFAPPRGVRSATLR